MNVLRQNALGIWSPEDRLSVAQSNDIKLTEVSISGTLFFVLKMHESHLAKSSIGTGSIKAS